MCKLLKRKADSSIEDNRNWSSLNTPEQNDINQKYTGHGQYLNTKLQALSDLVFNWLFILNSGGLVSVVTLYTSNCNKADINNMFYAFIAGIVLIYIATKLSQLQSYRKGKSLDKVFVELTLNKINIGEYENKIYEEIFPCDLLIFLIEALSLLSFIAGLIIAFSNRI